MPWPVPTPDVIASRAAAVYEGTPALAGIDARDPTTVATAHCRALATTAFDLYLYQANEAVELMPDTAVATLDRHASIWGVPRQGPVAAIGNAIAQAAEGASPTSPVVIPAGQQATSSGGAIYVVSNATTLESAAAVSVPVAAQLPGAPGNLSPGSLLTLVSPVPGLAVQTLTVDSNGIAGGADEQSDDSLRAAILARIRQPPQGGAASDYVKWAKAAGAGYVSVRPQWTGLGTVGVIVAMPGPAACTPAELAEIDAFIQALRPVTAIVTTVAATLLPVDFTLHLNPDTTAIRAAATTALQLQIAADGQPGGTIYMSRIDAALENASGEFSHERSVPAADVVPTPTQLPVLGTVSFA